MTALKATLIICFLLPLSSFAELQIDRTPGRVAQGEYLVTAVLGCPGCHSERDLGRYSYPPKEGRALAGGVHFGDRVVSPNITPYGLSDWTDQQVVDAITQGIARDGRKLHAAMPTFPMMHQEDLYAVVAYLRAMPAIEAGPYPREFDSVEVEPPPVVPHVSDTAADDAQRGEYLVTIAGCSGCHQGAAPPGEPGAPLVGGNEFRLPGRGLIRSANLTPDLTTGIGAYTREAFVNRFTAMRGSEKIAVPLGENNTVMHWWAYAYMTEEDLGAIYSYLHTLAPVSNAVVRFEPLDGPLTTRNWSDRIQAAAAAAKD